MCMKIEFIFCLLGLLKERADSLVKYIFMLAQYYQKSSKSSKLLCHDKTNMS